MMRIMTTASVFLTHTTQAVRLPRAVAWPPEVKEVAVQVVGDTRILTPVGSSWTQWFATREPFEDSFLADRDQADADVREPW